MLTRLRRAVRARSAAPPRAFAISAIVAAATFATGGELMRSAPPARAGQHAVPTASHTVPTSSDPILARLGLPVAPASRLPGYLMIADRDNNRVIIVSPSKRVVWHFPAASSGTLSQPDDAFVSADGRYISINQEFAETIGLITLTRHPRLVWQYGHAGVQGSAPGYLAHPDDAYMLANGQIQVADIINCRLLWISRSKRIVRQIGSAANCTHNPPSALRDPNGDTPLRGGGVLITEIGGWVDRLDSHGRLVWSITTPTDYPSDAQLLPNGTVLLASYTSPGRIDIINSHGRVLWTYGPPSGSGSLDHPSLAEALPNGLIAVTDDLHDRVVLIDRATKRIVWQYGHYDVRGSAPGYLNNPDGLQLLP